MRPLQSILLCLLLLTSALCQGLHADDTKPRFLYDVDFVFDFDNREYHDSYDQSRTILGIRLTPTIGVGFADSLGGQHRLMAGVSYIQPCGADWRRVQVRPTVYYQWAIRGFRASLGFVPFDQLYAAMPEYLRSDSLAFMSPNIQGALFQYQSRWGYVQAHCDWRGMFSPETREAFRIVADGRFHYEWVFMGGYAQINHLANSEGQTQGVNDDILINPLLGMDFTSKTPLDSLSLQVGYLCGIQRDRHIHTTHVAHGMHADFMLRWRFIGLRNALYVGQNQMPFYPTYGSLLNQGDPHFQAKLYNRTDLYFYLIRRSFVTCYAGWNLLVTDRGTISHQQQIVCRFNLDAVLHDRRKATIRTLSYR